MNTTIELDQYGRILIPKETREAAGLKPGDSLEIEIRGEDIVLHRRRKGKGLYKKKGLWVYDSGVPMSAEDANLWIERSRKPERL